VSSYLLLLISSYTHLTIPSSPVLQYY
jgi:hypothetical protein